MNPFAIIAQLLKIKEKTPLSVYFSYIRPMRYPLPKEVAQRYFKSEEQNLLMSFVSLENFTTKVLKNIRFKLKSPLGFEPKLEASTGRIVKYFFDKEKLEIVIDCLDPNEYVDITLFPNPTKLTNDFEPVIIIDDELLTKGMMRMGHYKKYPKLMMLSMSAIALSVLLTLSLIWGEETGEYIRNLDPNYVLKQDANRRVIGNGCVLEIIDISSDIDWYLKRSPVGLEFNLNANNVKTYNDLIKLDKAAICLPYKIK